MLLQNQKEVDKDITSKSVNILLIEDNEGDVRLIKEMLKDVSNLSFKVENSFLLMKAIKILERRKFDAILLDLNLPDSIGLETVSKTLEVIHDTPIVILTGLNEEDLAISTVKMGAQDYLVKEQLNSMLLVRSIQYAIERKKTEQKLKESEERYRNLVEDAQECIWALDQNENTTFVNPKMCEMLGYTKNEMMGKNLHLLIPDSMTERIKGNRIRREKGIKETYNLELVKKDGTIIYTNIKAAPIMSEDRVYKGSFAYVTDVTTQKHAEDTLRESEELFRTIFETAKDCIFIKDRSLQYIRINKAMEELFGVPSEDLLNKTDIEIFGLEAGKHVMEIDQRVIQGEIIEEEATKPINGIPHTFHTIKVPLKDIQGNIYGLCGFARDISDRKIFEQKLIESEEKYRTLSDYSMVGISIIQDMQFKYINQKFADNLGYSIEELLNMKPNELYTKIVHPEQLEDVINVSKKFQEGRDSKTVEYAELHCLKNNGDSIWLELFTRSIHFEGRRAEMSASINITEQRKNQRDLIESEEKFRTLFEIAPASIIVSDLESNIILFNQRFCNLHGITQPELLKGRKIQEFVAERDRPILKEAISKTFSGEPRGPIQYTMYKEDGKEFLAEGISSALKDKNGKSVGLIGVVQDITERVRSEQKLIESEEKYRLLFERANDAIFLLGSDGFIDTNDYILKMFGYNEKSEFIGLKPWELSPHKQPDSRNSKEKAIEFINNCLEGKPQRFYWKHSRKDGTPFDADVSLNRIFIENKYFVQAIVRDITDRIKSEQQIRESEEKYRDLLETAAMGIIEFDVEENKVSYINPKLLEILGYTKEDLLYEETFLKIAHPEDQKELIKSSEDRYVEFRIFTKEGKLKWLSGTRKNRFNKEGNMISARLWLQDSTESKEIEEIKSNLLTRFSHEFKTPLISIKGFADFLLSEHNKDFDDKTISFLKKIKHGGDRLKELVNSFIESSQLDRALTKLKLHQENLSDLIKTGLEEMQGLISLREHTINLDIQGQLIASVDKEKIYSVITNLLLNAINYTPKGGKIWIQSTINEGSIIVSVKDNGIGLDDTDKKQLFKPFGKIEKYGKGWDIVSEGMGMGLYLSKEIMNLHGGKIWVESKGRNKGTTFYFSIPIVTN